MNDNDIDECIKPSASEEDIRFLLDKFYGIQEVVIQQLNGYDDLNYLCDVKKFYNQNFSKDQDNVFIFKIMNSLDSRRNEFVKAQNNVLLFLENKRSVSCPTPVKTINGEYYGKEKLPVKEKSMKKQREHVIRLLKYIPGTLLKDINKSYELFQTLGETLAILDQTLKDFRNPFYETHTSAWHLKSASQVKSFIHFVKDTEKKQLVENILHQFSLKVLSNENNFEKGLIHGDFNEHNILLTRETSKWTVAGILDFGDSHYSCYIYEVAIALCYMMFECKRQNLDPISGAGYFLSGYFKIKPFDWDFKTLKLCICARICQSLVLGLKAYHLNPNNSYVLDSQHIGWLLLKELQETSTEKIAFQWKNIIELL